MGARSATPAKDVNPKKVELKEDGEDVEKKVVQNQDQPASKSHKERLLGILVRLFAENNRSGTNLIKL